MNPPAMRLFIALEPPEELKSALAAWRESAPPSARPTPPEQYHLTLVFLGNTPPMAAERLTAGFAAAFSGAPAARLIPVGFGCFPSSSRPGSLHLEFEAEPGMLDLKRRAEELVLRITGKTAEPRRFTPHMTLLRFRGGIPAEDRKIIEELSRMRRPSTMAVAAVLFHSRSEAGRLHHTPLARAELPCDRQPA